MTKPHPCSFEGGVQAAYDFGSEHQVNPGSSQSDYYDDAARHFRVEAKCYSDLTLSERFALRRSFSAGRRSGQELESEDPAL